MEGLRCNLKIDGLAGDDVVIPLRAVVGAPLGRADNDFAAEVAVAHRVDHCPAALAALIPDHAMRSERKAACPRNVHDVALRTA